LEDVRLRHAKLSIRMGESTRNSTYDAGHNSNAWLYSERNTAKFGMHPSVYKSGGVGLSITYTATNCPLGRILVARTDSGICFVALGSSDEGLLMHLRAEYPNARLSADGEDRELHIWVSDIVEYLEGKASLDQNKNLPVDVTATAFQIRVWNELRKIPYGMTRSYREVAKRIGNPKAYRAVANACGSNKVPLVVPCHRVVRQNGDLGGYRWGVERKKRLLAMENENVPKLNGNTV